VNWTDLGGGVRVRKSARYAMNSVVLLDPEHTVLIDPGILPSEIDDIAEAVAEVSPDAITLVFTHPHWDHVLGRGWWQEAETLAHDGFAATLQRDLAHVRAEAERVAAEAGQRWPHPFTAFTPRHAVSGLHFRRLGPWRLVLRDAFGHCGSQLDVHLPEQRILIAADMLSDIEIPGLDAPPDVYRAALDQLLPVAHGGAIETLVPGHGAIAHGPAAVMARFQADLDYLDAIEDGARAGRAEGLDAAGTVAKLAGMDYPGKHASEYPMEPIHEENVKRAWRAAGGKPHRA
jgi:glyoxylase-like metal-dependent hydrolase (beta-lactamase superfamily II)